MIRPIHPRYWLRHASVRRAIRNYPYYDVPHKQKEITLGEQMAQENFSYFMGERVTRLSYFTGWLRTNFRIDAALTGDGLRKVSQWVDDYGGALIGDEADRLSIYQCYQPRWEGPYVGYNVMMDIGVFLGEYLVSKRPKLGWEIYRGNDNIPTNRLEVEYLKPCLGGIPLFPIFPLNTAFGVVANSHQRALIQSNYDHTLPDALIIGAKSALYMSRMMADPNTVVIGDSSNECL